MILLVSGATRHVAKHLVTPQGCKRLGGLLTPDAGNKPPAGIPWAADNSAFSGFKPDRYCRMLGKLCGMDPLWVTVPDVVADAVETCRLFAKWVGCLEEIGLPPALVAQDGLEGLEVPWDRLQCLFVGGSTDWKLSASAADLVSEAKRRGKLVHFGRVNTRKRIEHAYRIGCDSFDGSGFSRWPAVTIPLALKWMAEIEAQPLLFAG